MGAMVRAMSDTTSDTPVRDTAAVLAIVESAFSDVARDGEAAIDRLLTVYADDVRFEDPIQTLHDKAGFDAANRRLLHRAREISFEVLSRAVAGGDAFLTWRMRMTPRVGPALRFEGVTHLRVSGGLVVEHRDYWDLLGAFLDSVPVLAPVYRTLVARLG